jgi:hypothetical protein
VGGADTVVAGINEWRITKTVAEIPVNHFEASADGDGNVWPTYEKGLAGATVTVRGIYNVDGTDKTEGGTPSLALGLTVSMDLLFTRTPFGYLNVAGFITQFETGIGFENQLGTFSMTVRCTSAVGDAA